MGQQISKIEAHLPGNSGKTLKTSKSCPDVPASEIVSSKPNTHGPASPPSPKGVSAFENQRRIDEARIYLLAVGSLVHVLQAERGCSVMHIASKGTRAQETLDSARKRSDFALAKLQMTPVFKKLPIAKTLEQDLEDIRAKVSADTIPFTEVQEVYGGIIQHLWSSASVVTEPLENTEVDRIVTAYLIFARIKDSHGQLRGSVAGILASGNCKLDEGQYQHILTLLGTMRAFTSSFDYAVPSPFRPLPKRFLDKCSSLPRQAEAFQKALLTSQKEAEEMLSTMTPDEWFSMMSSRMDSMDEVQTALADEIERLAKKQLSQFSMSSAPHHKLFPAVVNLAEGIKSKEDSAFIGSIVEREWHIELDQVKLLHELGRGVSGTVYLGEWENQHVAVKVITDNTMSGNDNKDEVVKEFCTEVKVLSKLRHPNVCVFLGASVSPPKFCMVLEYMDNGTLWQMLRQSPQDINFLGMSIQLARGMKHLHEKGGLVHRDLKSPNVMLNSQKQLKIVDFGLTMAGANRNEATAEVGTLRWMAPEVMSHNPYSYSADVYSFAVILWELLTKDVPWRPLQIEGRLPPMSMFRAVKEDHKRPAIPEGTPWSIHELIVQCWHPDPEKRPAFGDILHQLERASISATASEREFLNKKHAPSSSLVTFQPPAELRKAAWPGDGNSPTDDR